MKDMSDNSFIDKIDFSKSNHYTLSIRLDTDGFSFSIYNPLNDTSLKYFPQEINTSLPMPVNVRNILEKTESFHHTYKEVNILQISNRYTLIPFDLFDEDHLENFFHYNFTQKENEKVCYNLLRRTNIILAFEINQLIYKDLTERFPSCKFHTQGSVLVEHFATKSRFGNSKKMYIYVRKNDIDIFCYERSNVILANTFHCKNTEDIIYYSLYIWKQLGFNQEKDELHLCSLKEDKESLVNKLKEFIRQVFIINSKAELYISQQEKIPYDMQILSLKEV